MTTDVITLLARYNSHVNTKMNKFISQLTPSEWEKELGGFYKNIKSLCSHIYIVDLVWFKRFGTFRSFNSLKNSVVNAEFLWDSSPFNNTEEYINKRTELDSIIISFANEITSDDLEKYLKYKSWKGEDQNRNFGGLLIHVFNHQTHHRGMISLYLELLGKANDYSNLVELV